MTESGTEFTAVLRFWFEEAGTKAWWTPDPGFDETIRRRFAALYGRAIQGELVGWRSQPQGRLAEIIVLDQFSRNLFRGSASAFAQDLAALVLAQEAVSAGAHLTLEPAQTVFLLLPYMHSESREVHATAERLFREFTPAENLDFEMRHKAIIDRFGLYPHRNEALGRASTPEELEFLGQPGSSF
jgi:uncharacterized protein (DUF924 family)